MKKLSKITLGVLAAVAVSVPSAGAVPGGAGSAQATTRPDVAQMREQAEARAQERRLSVEQRKAAIMQQVEERRAEIKQEICERRQEKLTAVMPRLAQGATSVKSSLDTVYNRVVGFYESGQLTVENYETLVGNVEAAKADSEGAIAAINEQSFTLDCEEPNVGQQLDGYRTAVKEARTALMDYRAALVDLISAMRAAAAVENEENGDETGDAAADQADAARTEGGSDE